jgi:hypothetical protein
MDLIVPVNVIAASAGLLPLLQAARWDGAIAAVFRRSLLVGAPDARLLHLHTGPQLVSPFSLRLEDAFATALHHTTVVPGIPVRKLGFAINIGEHLRLRLDETIDYQPPQPPTGEIDVSAVKIARQTLRSEGRSGGFDQLPDSQTLITAIHQAIADGNPDQISEAGRRLIGLGPGLTPSGDDVLVGCLRGLWLTSQDAAATRQKFARIGAGFLSTLDERTTRVGAEFIRYALNGVFAEILDYAAEALLAPTHPQRVQSAIRQLLAQGETSGADTTHGLLACVEASLAHLWRHRSPTVEHTSAVVGTSAVTQG